MSAALTAALPGLLLVVTGAFAVAAVLVAAAGYGRPTLWGVAVAISAAALVTQWLIPAGLRLYEYHCGPLCGSGAVLMPAAAALSAVGAAGILSTRHRWVPRPFRIALAFAISVVMLFAGVYTWIA